MKKLVAIISFGFISSLTFANSGSGLVWYTNLDSAVSLSNDSSKPVFGFFTGSDWCGWCIKLQRNVFSKQAFIDWAQANVILLEVDFPRSKVQTTELKQQNQGLQQAFGVTGYPTCWIFTGKKDATTNNMSLTAWGKLGYPSGPEVVVGKEEDKFLKDAAAVMDKNPALQKQP